MRRKETANDKDEESFCSFVWKGAWCQQNRARPIVLVFNVHKKEGKSGGGGGGDQVTLKSSIALFSRMSSCPWLSGISGLSE